MPAYGYDEMRDRISRETELRIHGIGGSTPERLLRDINPVLVGGDEIAGFYRPRDETSLQEAYAWGGLTARANVRALWILLLPFALVNVAGWMIPRPEGRPRPVVEGGVRAIALGSTVALVSLLGASVVDLVVLQCGLQESCANQSVWLRWMDSGFLAGEPTRLVVVGLMVPVLGLVFLWALGRRTRERYEERFEMPAVAPSTLDNPMAQPGFWASTGTVRSLASLHIAAGLASMAASAEWYYFRLDRYRQGLRGEFEGPWTQWFTGIHVVGLVGLALLVTCVIVAMTPASARERWSGNLRTASVAAFAVAAVDGLRRTASGPIECSATPGAVATDCTYLTGQWFAGFTWSMTFVPLVILLVLLAGRGLWDWKSWRRDQSLVMFGSGPFVAVATGLIVLTSVLAGSALLVAELLGDRPGPDAEPPLIRVFTDWEVASLGLLVYLATLGLWLLFRSVRIGLPRSARATRIDAIEKGYYEALNQPVPPRTQERERWLREIDRRQRVRSEWMPVLGQPLGLGVAVALVMAVTYLLDREVFGGELFLRYVFLQDHAWTDLLLTLSRWIIVLIPGVAVLLLWRSFRNPEIRRNVGTLWDVLTFWPRWFHPFAPPAYSARAVPEMAVRLQDRLTNHGPVVLSAHSQGSVIAAAALLTLAGRANPVSNAAQSDGAEPQRQQAAEALGNIGLVTHGSPIGSLYGRFFPAYFSRPQLTELSTNLTGADGRTRWRNLYRCTDPIGLPLFVADDCTAAGTRPTDAAIDVRCPDPDFVSAKAGDPYPRIRGHSDYYLEECYASAIQDLLAALQTRSNDGEGSLMVTVRGRKDPALPGKILVTLRRYDDASGELPEEAIVQVDDADKAAIVLEGWLQGLRSDGAD